MQLKYIVLILNNVILILFRGNIEALNTVFIMRVTQCVNMQMEPFCILPC